MNVQELYHLDENDDWFCFSDYDPMITAIGTVAVRRDDADWQGDTRLLYKDGDRYGFLVFGWGSCSGCDALRACQNFDGLQELADHLERSVVWGTAEEILAHIDSREEANDFYCHDDNWDTFVSMVHAYFKEA